MTGSGSALFALFASQAERDFARKTLQEDGVFWDCRVMPARLVSGNSYRRLWRRQLGEYIEQPRTPDENLWPPRSRHDG